MEKLSVLQRGLLRQLSDGARYNLLAWPILDEDDDCAVVLGTMWAVANLAVRDLVHVEDPTSDSAVWLSITGLGLRALEEHEERKEIDR